MFKSFIRISVLLTTVVGLAAVSPSINADTPTITERLLAEFNGAYPSQSAPTGHLETVRLVAAPGQWGLMPPYQTSVWAYNGQVPGPVIRIQLGDTLRVKLVNQLPEPTTIHWHGVRVPNAMDGVPGVNQEPVAPGESFTYEFTPKDPGIFWFHPHLNSAEQVERGLHGVLVIEDPNEPHYSQDLVWVLDDWRLNQDGSIDSKFVTRHDLAHDGRWGNYLTVNGAYRPVVTVKPGERLRLRMVNVANGRVFVPVFEHLTPQVIAIDGMRMVQEHNGSPSLMSPWLGSWSASLTGHRDVLRLPAITRQRLRQRP
ncbi:MAG: multicopper oxidase domain-containing protein [Candidatus Tectomicrobia bacterium]|nr:multicopper oxidase domain-containing protein [Candidatus Tectomicrobia bacterium]